MSQLVIYHDESVTVTDQQIAIRSTVYEVPDLISVAVRVKVEAPDVSDPTTLAAIALIATTSGIFCLLVSISIAATLITIGVALLGAAFVWAGRMESETLYLLVLSTACGEVDALVSTNCDYIGRVACHISRAIGQAD